MQTVNTRRASFFICCGSQLKVKKNGARDTHHAGCVVMVDGKKNYRNDNKNTFLCFIDIGFILG